jgi:ABC-type long-subunit fatty acid transport system fused permease/ATPase subunit
MGSFRNKFKRYVMSEHFYTFSTIERAVTSFVVVMLAPSIVASAVTIGIFTLETIFLAVNQPYML